MASPAELSAQDRAATAAIFHLYDPPLWLVTAVADGRRGAMIATSVVRASIVAELPRILIAIAKQHYTWGLIAAGGAFSLQLLPQEALDLVMRIGTASGHASDKLSELELATTPQGHPLYAGALSWMDCRVESATDIGDRSVLLAAIQGARLLNPGSPLSVGLLLREASPAQHARLKQLYARDQQVDAAAIRAWRAAR